MDNLFRAENIRNEIFQILNTKKISFHHMTHKETIPENIAKELGIDMQKTIKSLIIRGKKSKKNYLTCLLGHQKIDMPVLISLLGEKCELEKINTLKERFGIDVGGVCPFGNLLNISDIYFDEGIKSCKDIIIGCGIPNESIQMKLDDLISLIHPKFVKIAL
jgi:nondiscriminating aspartyl-tRNA synthetase